MQELCATNVYRIQHKCKHERMHLQRQATVNLCLALTNHTCKLSQYAMTYVTYIKKTLSKQRSTIAIQKYDCVAKWLCNISTLKRCKAVLLALAARGNNGTALGLWTALGLCIRS